MNYKKWAIPRLCELEAKRAALNLVPLQIRALEQAAAALKSPRLDKEHVAGGESNAREAALIANIAERDKLRRNLELTAEEVKVVDCALAGLPEEERHILDCFYVHRSRGAAEKLCSELGYEKSAVYELKEKALINFARRLYGIVEV